MLISIVMAYYNRKPQFLRTLESIKRSNIKDFELIIVDDASDIEHRLEDTAAQHPFIKLIRVEPKDKWYVNPCIPYNMGFAKATGDIIIIQNPECYHYNDILQYASNNITKHNYISFGCYSLDEKLTNSIAAFNIAQTLNCGITYDGQLGWYNHSIYRPVGYHFCSAILRENLLQLEGFDTRYAEGIGYDDNEFLLRIKKLGLNINIANNCVVLHQWHYTTSIYMRKDSPEKCNRNKLIFERDIK